MSLRLQAYTDYSDSVSRRMGFIPLPLALLVSFPVHLLSCVLYRWLRAHVPFNEACVAFSVDQGGDEFSEDPGFPLVYVCAAVLPGVNAELFAFSSTLPNVCTSRVMFALVSLCVSRMITLKVLNSIVLLGTSCTFVKEANMEEKLFDPPPSAASSRVNSRAHRTKHVHTAPQKGSSSVIGTVPELLDVAFG